MSTLTDQIAADWTEAPYYDLVESERAVGVFWNSQSIFRQLFSQLNIQDHLIELACGRGRHTDYVLRNYGVSIRKATMIDVNKTNIDFCRKRFSGQKNVHCIKNDGRTIPLPADCASAIFCYDAMVHFEYDDVAKYLKEMFRVLRPGGRAVIHHSNNTLEAGRLYSQCVHWRNYMSASLFRHMAARAGLDTLQQKIIDWGKAKDLDAITLIQKP